ncbi:MAG: RloB domain-containing protein [Candidatus Sabulitectum sp.]|nr:RloB domain-containing protein [Candidatus Sabulitectum sp.]
MKSKRRRRSFRKVYSIIVDGETEKWYLDLLKEHEKDRLPRIDITPEIPKKKRLADLDKLIRSNAEEYHMVFWIVDLDAIRHDGQMDRFLEYIRELKKIKNVRVFVNNPCLEFWFLLHLKETSRIFPRCDKVENELRKHQILKNYEKTEKYYKSNNDIYKRLKPNLNIAIDNAEKLGEFSLEEPHFAMAEISQIFDLILE